MLLAIRRERTAEGRPALGCVALRYRAQRSCRYRASVRRRDRDACALSEGAYGWHPVLSAPGAVRDLDVRGAAVTDRQAESTLARRDDYDVGAVTGIRVVRALVLHLTPECLAAVAGHHEEERTWTAGDHAHIRFREAPRY